LLLAILWALFLAAAIRRFKSAALMPCLLVGAVVLADAILAVIKVHDPSLQIPELMFHGDTRFVAGFPFSSGVISKVDWGALASLAPNIFAVIFITVLTALLTCTGLESALDKDGDLDHELKIQGAANIVSGLSGGYVGLISVGTTMAARSAGAGGRLTGAATALICLVVLAGGMTVLNDIPRFIVGGLQLFLGTQVLWTWGIASRNKMPVTEWILVLSILAIAVWFGFLPAILSGILGGCIIFAMDVSLINIVRRVYAVNDRGSVLVRSTDEAAVLAREGASAKIVELNGYIFFGSAYQMLSSVKALVGASDLYVLVLDFTGVTGGDSSAAAVLNRLDKLLKREKILPIFAGIRPEIFPLFQNSGILNGSAATARDRDSALQEAENRILARAGTPAPSTISLKAWLARSLGGREFAEALVPFLQCADAVAGTYLCRQGDPTDTLMYIETGRVAVIVASGGSEMAVRIFGPHTVAGEQGFILRQLRSASLKVEEDARVWSLPRDAYDQLVHSNASLVIALMRDIVRVQSERLGFATRQATALAG
jgi:SulP family sulfate permease